MDENFLAQILGGLHPEDGSQNPYAMQPPMAPPAAPPPVSIQPDFSALPMPAGPNFMSTLPGGVNAPQPAPDPAPRQPRERHSLLDKIGQVADVLAKVGGAAPLYQPTLDARQDRALALDDHSRAVDLDKLKLATEQLQLQTSQNGVVGQALRGLQAIKAANPQAVASAWPILARQAGVSDDRAAALGQLFQSNPEAIDGLASMFGGQEYGLQPFYARDKDGNVSAYQLGKDGSVHPVVLPDGAAPVDPMKIVDTGNAQVAIGERSGLPLRILPKFEAPGKAEDRSTRLTIAREGNATSDTNNRRDNATRVEIAGMPARSKPGAGAGGTGAPNMAMVKTASGLLRELDGIYDNLNKSGAIVSSTSRSGIGNLVARARNSGVGQSVEGAVGTAAQTQRDRINSIRPALMQSLAKATGMSGKQLDSNADVKLFMQTVTDPTKSYEANKAAIAGLRRFLQENLATSVQNARPAAPARPRSGGPTSVPVTIRPKRPAPTKPAAGGWSIVGVK